MCVCFLNTNYSWTIESGWKVAVQGEVCKLSILTLLNLSSELSLLVWYFHEPIKHPLEHKNTSHCSSLENTAKLTSWNKPFKRKHQCQADLSGFALVCMPFFVFQIRISLIAGQMQLLFLSKGNTDIVCYKLLYAERTHRMT